MEMNKVNFSFFDNVEVEKLKNKKGIIELCYEESLKNNLIRRLNIVDINFLKIKIEYKKINKTDMNAFYKLHIKGLQECVVTLEKLKFIIKKDFNMRFIDSNKLDIEKLDDEYLEPIHNKRINFGEIATQMLSIFLDPYPRSNKVNSQLNLINNRNKKNYLNNNAFEVLNKIKK